MDNQNQKQYYIVRGDRSGLYTGNIESQNGKEVVMTNVRNIWHWNGACGVMQLALDGPDAGRETRITVELPEITVLDAVAIYPCSAEAEKIFREAKPWRR